MSKSRKTPQRNVFLKCNDHFAQASSNLWLDENAQCSSCIKFESTQTLKSGILPRNSDVISLLLTKRAQNTGKKVNNFNECAIITSLLWVNCNIYPASLRNVERKIEGLFQMYQKIKKFTKKSDTYWQKCNEFLSIQKNLFDIIGEYFYVGFKTI